MKTKRWELQVKDYKNNWFTDRVATDKSTAFNMLYTQLANNPREEVRLLKITEKVVG